MARLETTDLPAVSADCQMLILYEDFAAYERAVEVCRRMMTRFAYELDFDFKCWNFVDLADAGCAHSALKTVGTADIILLAMHGMELPPAVDEWLASFPANRLRGDGALALVWDKPPGSSGEQLLARLGQLARQSKMDFVLLVPSLPWPAIEILHNEDWPAVVAPQCDHWGLNE